MKAISRAPAPRSIPSPWRQLTDRLSRIPAGTIPNRKQLELRATHFLATHGHHNADVSVDVSSGFEAYATGSVGAGEITLGRALMALLTTDEIDFVLAHEVIHLSEAHILGRLPFRLARSFYETVGRREPMVQLGLIAYDIWKMFQHSQGTPPPAEALIKEQELQADAGAVRLTGKLGPAVSALTKLAGGDLDGPSHTWEALSVELPVFTVRERIRELHRTFPDWE